MIVYAVTVTVPADLADEWSTWMCTVHIADVMATGCWTSARFCRHLQPPLEAHVTFVTEYTCESYADYEHYRDVHAPRLQAHHNELFGTRASATRAIFEVAQEFSA